MSRKRKKTVSLVLALIMLVGMLPRGIVYADPGDQYTLVEAGVGYSFGQTVRIVPAIIADDNPLGWGNVSAIQTHELRQNGTTVIWGYCLEPNATTSQGDSYVEAKNYASRYADKIKEKDPAMYRAMCRVI